MGTNEGSATRSVYAVLKDMIMRGEVEPGSELNERALAHKLGVSRTPVREALLLLEHEGFALRVGKKGVHVKSPSVQELTEVFDLQWCLERFAIEEVFRTRVRQFVGRRKA